MTEDDPVKIPIDGILDLHTFHPKDVKDLVLEKDPLVVRFKTAHYGGGSY